MLLGNSIKQTPSAFRERSTKSPETIIRFTLCKSNNYLSKVIAHFSPTHDWVPRKLRRE